MIRKGTTPTFKLILNDDSVDLTQARNVYATFKQNTKEITKTGEDIAISEREVDVYLSQEETLAFTYGKIEIQLNWTYGNNERACSEIVAVNIANNLIERVLE